MKKRLVVGLSGASGAILCVSLLEAMRRDKDWEVHLVTSEAGERVLHEETGMSGAGICHGYAENLLLRAADVTLKERRKLVLVAREAPLGLVHLRNMTALAEMGVTILPPMLTYYQHPQSIEDMTTHIVGKIMREFRLEAPGFRRWEGS